MSFHYRPAVRAKLPLLLGFAGGTGSGKTYSALRIACGLSPDEPFHLIDTENGRALHYADEFDFMHGELAAPFRPSRYAEAIEAADKAGAKVIVVDSMTHSWAGDGGVLDWHEEEMGGDPKKQMRAWKEPKQDHRRMVTRLLQVKAHVILCFRAEPKVDVVMENGKMKIVPKATLTGLDGWIPIADKNLPFELTASFLLMADNPGVPRPIKLPERLRDFVHLDVPLDEQTGARLGEWARGTESGAESIAGAKTGTDEPDANAPSAPVQDPGAPHPSPASEPAAGPDAPVPQVTFAENIAALNALVTDLSDRGVVSKRNVWAAVADMRGVKSDSESGKKPSDILLELLSGVDAEGVVHWSALRDSLTEEEAATLRQRLGRKWAEAREPEEAVA